jgi:hypothetical protein
VGNRCVVLRYGLSLAPDPDGQREGGHTDSPRPKLAVLWALALAGCPGAALAVALGFSGDHVPEPGLRAALLDWIVLHTYSPG